MTPIKATWTVRLKCTVYKELTCSSCTEEQARNNPWYHADDEHETDQIDWEVLLVTPSDKE